MGQGPNEAFIVEQARRQQQPIPQAILDAPELFPSSRVYYDAFLKLSSCRAVGMGTGPIPWTAVAEFAARKGFEGVEAEILWVLISEMDHAYCKQMNKDKPSDGKPMNGKDGGLRSQKHKNTR